MSRPVTFTRSHIWSVVHIDAPEIVTSAWIDEQLAETFERLGVRPGLLESVAGINARRWWPPSVSFDDAASRAGLRALEQAGVAPSEVDLLISTSVCKHHLEPSVACAVHNRLGLPATCMNFDLGNACLGFINAMTVASSLIESGQVNVVLIVDGEGSRQPQEQTIARLRQSDSTLVDVFDQFASLTLGSGAAAMVMGTQREGSHQFLGGVTRAETKHHELCVGDLDEMRTDTAALLESGLALAEVTFNDALAEGWKWTDCDTYILHQVSAVHTTKLCELLSIDQSRVPLSFPDFGNMGPAAIPYTLSVHAEHLSSGDRVLLMGIGSGLNCSVAELVW
ncbi:MAG: 3-oxoacyl-ACP synthase III [Acidimicrobiales bacterium]